MATDTPTTVTTPDARPAVRAVVSLLVMLHVAAVFVGPWAMPPNSRLAVAVGRVFQPYLDVLSLGNGYRFFAPEPGPSHLVRYEVTLDDGTLVEGSFPNRTPSNGRGCFITAISCSANSSTRWQTGPSKERAEAYARGYARHLAEKYTPRA